MSDKPLPEESASEDKPSALPIPDAPTVPSTPSSGVDDGSLTLDDPSPSIPSTPPPPPESLLLKESKPTATLDTAPLKATEPASLKSDQTKTAPQRRVTFQDVLVSLGSGLLAGGLVLLLNWVAGLALQNTLQEMNVAVRWPLEVSLISGIAFFIALGLGVWQRVLGFVAALVSGIVVGLVLFAIWQSYGPDTPIYNQLLYGIPGIVSGLALSALGGWVGMQVRVAFGAPAALSTPARLGVGAIVIWFVGEIIARVTSALVLVPQTGNALASNTIAAAVAFPLMTAAIVFLAHRRGIKREDWSYGWSVLNAIIGGVTGLVLFAIMYFVTRQVDTALWGPLAAQQAEQTAAMMQGNPGWVTALFVLVSGVLVPICEEWSWRGVIQTGLTRGMGLLTGFIITMLAFVLKSVLVTLSVANITSLLVFAIGLGLLRARLGTASSTTAHIVVGLLGVVVALVWGVPLL